LANAVFDSVFKNEIDGTHNMPLADTVYAANALFYAHGVPWHVKVDDDVAEL
jgi:hypothetical protein